jgi:hypothetical protein
MDSPTLVAVSSLGGVLLGIGGSVANTWMAKRFEDRRHLRELALNLGLEDFKTQMAEAVRKSPSRGSTVAPLGDYVVHMLCLADLIDRKGAHVENVRDLLSGARRLAAEMKTFYENDPSDPSQRPPQ